MHAGVQYCFRSSTVEYTSLKPRRVKVSLSGDNLGQVVHTRVPLLPSSIIWYRPSEGDALQDGSGVALAMHQRPVVYPPTDSPGRRNEHPACTPHGVWHSLPLPDGCQTFIPLY